MRKGIIRNKIFKKGFGLLLTAAVASATFMAGCSGGGATSNNGAVLSDEASNDAVITYAQIATWDTLFPWSKSNYYSIGPTDKIFDTLAVSNIDGTVSPRAAESWEFSEDGLSVTVHLNKNSKWHDGEPVTSADWLWTFETIGNPEVTTATSKSYLNILRGYDSSGNIDTSEEPGVEAPDDYTLDRKSVV